MLLDWSELQQGQELRCDICILGAGPAGITIARQLATKGRDVLLVESGGFQLDSATQQLYAGSAEGTIFREQPDYCLTSRLRYFGGSSNHWDGWCREFDGIDFEPHAWRGDAAWPFKKPELTEWYHRAAEIVEIRPFPERDADRVVPIAPLFPEPVCGVNTSYFHYSPPTRFGERYRAELVASETVRVLLQANVTELLCSESGALVTGVSVATLTGKSLKISAQRVVLALGGIENARLLLNSRQRFERGAANSSGCVGRYFSDHPHVRRAAEIVLFEGNQRTAVYDRFIDRSLGHEVRAVLAIDEATRRAEGLLGMSAEVRSLEGRRNAPPEADREIATALSALAAVSSATSATTPALATLMVRAEQRPDAECRVTLSNERDELGMLRSKVTWRWSAEDIASISRSLELVARALVVSSHGRLRLNIDLDPATAPVWGGKHHMGTTRMGAAPASSVVDANCRAHDVMNLYIAGSSVFPTYSYANPTLTIVALALRLASHLIEDTQ